FVAAKLVAFFGRGVERARNFWLHRVTMGAAGIGHVDRQRGTGALHGGGCALAIALLQRRGTRGSLGRIIKSLAVGAAFANGKRTRTPSLGDKSLGGKTRSRQQQSQRQNEQGAALGARSRNNQNPLPRGNPGLNLSGGRFHLVNGRLKNSPWRRLSAPSGFQRLRRVDVEERTV